MTFLNFIEKYWSQTLLLFGGIGFMIKTVLEYRLKNKELRNKYFYELKAQKIIELYLKIVQIQITIDRHVGGASFENIILRQRLSLDRYYWESELYFSPKTKKNFRLFLELLKFYETSELLKKNPEIKNNFQKVTTMMLREFKKEII